MRFPYLGQPVITALGEPMPTSVSSPTYDYYVDSVNGDDGNTGTSLAQAFPNSRTIRIRDQAGGSCGICSRVLLARNVCSNRK